MLILSIMYNSRYDCIKSSLKLLLWLLSIAILCWTLLWYWGNMRSPEQLISRRLANLPFVLWQVSCKELCCQTWSILVCSIVHFL